MPDYDISNNRVQVTIIGHILDINYSMLLSKHKDLTLSEIEMLNRILFKKPLTDYEISELRKKKLIEGRKPNIYLAKTIAEVVNKKIEYTKNRGLDDNYYKKLILEALKQHKKMSRKEIDNLLSNKLPDILSENQKYNRVRNLLTSLRTDGKITTTTHRYWILNEI